jgi:outer membrane biosynthesis protein TonB
MTEGLFLITTLFVAYVVYVIANEKKANAAATKPAPASAPPEPKATVEEKPKITEAKTKPVTTKAATKPAAAPKPAAAKKAAPAAVKAEPQTIKGSGLKDPKTGEVATTYTNYRFTKRWIKEALVAEKLVEKIYKNDEIDADVEAKIKAGIIKLEGMKKYKP